MLLQPALHTNPGLFPAIWRHRECLLRSDPADQLSAGHTVCRQFPGCSGAWLPRKSVMKSSASTPKSALRGCVLCPQKPISNCAGARATASLSLLLLLESPSRSPFRWEVVFMYCPNRAPVALACPWGPFPPELPGAAAGPGSPQHPT